jgi:DNA-binding HxlR family transcriptional regulator
VTDCLDTACPIARAADVVGDRWMLQILRHATFGVTRFDQFRTQLGIADNVLANRLSRLVATGLLVKRPYHDGRRTRQEYRLTEAGADMLPVLHALAEWGGRHTEGAVPTEPMRVLHLFCGNEMRPGDFCEHCDRQVDRDEIAWLRPWASEQPTPLAQPVEPSGVVCLSKDA